MPVCGGCCVVGIVAFHVLALRRPRHGENRGTPGKYGKLNEKLNEIEIGKMGTASG
jgi:hypothetical protein